MYKFIRRTILIVIIVVYLILSVALGPLWPFSLLTEWCNVGFFLSPDCGTPPNRMFVNGGMIAAFAILIGYANIYLSKEKKGNGRGIKCVRFLLLGAGFVCLLLSLAWIRNVSFFYK